MNTLGQLNLASTQPSHAFASKPPAASGLPHRMATAVCVMAASALMTVAHADEATADSVAAEGNATIGILAAANYPASKIEAWKTAEAGSNGEIIPLTDADVAAYVKTIKELSLVAEAVQAGMPQTTGVATPVTLAEDSEAAVVLKSNGMTDEKLRNVGYSLAAATAALDIGEERLNNAIAANAAMLRQLQVAAPPGPYQTIRADARAAYEMMSAWQNQPQQNLTLAQRYRAELESVHAIEPTDETESHSVDVEANTFVESE